MKAAPAQSSASARATLLQRKCACGNSSGQRDECEGCGKKRTSGVQAKLTVGSSGDEYEQEADRVAERVMRMASPHAGQVKDTSSDGPLVRRRVSEEASGLTEAPPIVEEALRSPGEALDQSARAFFEPRFGHDFSRVRVHADARGAESARAVGARAYTVGSHTVFGKGQYAPDTSEGRRLLAHELTHVVQQSRLGARQRIGPQLDPFEREAGHGQGHVTNTESGGRGEFSFAPLRLQREEGPEETPPGTGPSPAGPGPERVPATGPEPMQKGRTDKFGKECPDTVVIGGKKAIPAFNKQMFDAGFRTYFGLVSNMKVGPKDSYEACITEVLKVEENTCGKEGNMADYQPCTPKKHCMQVNSACGGDALTDTKFPCSATTFVDLHRTDRKVSLLENSGKTECKVKCLQRYGCGGQEIGRFYVTRNFKAGTFTDGANKVPITMGTIEKEAAAK